MARSRRVVQDEGLKNFDELTNERAFTPRTPSTLLLMYYYSL